LGASRDLKDLVKLSTRDSVSVSGGDVVVGPDENNFDQNVQQGWGFDVRAVWYLDELIFRRESLDIARERRNWMEDRGRLLDKVTELYFSWKNEKNLKLKEKWAGHLDSYTGGWFLGELKK
jgi:hypothetical protein